MDQAPEIVLLPTTVNDLEMLFSIQLDKEAHYMAAFVSDDYTNKTAYINKFIKLLSDPTINMQTIYVDNKMAGSLSKFIMQGDSEITFGIDKSLWGKGIVTRALQLFLEKEKTRPLFGRCAFDNIGSARVMEKCGFKFIGTDRGFANARQEEIEEFVFRLD